MVKNLQWTKYSQSLFGGATFLGSGWSAKLRCLLNLFDHKYKQFK